MRSLPSHYIVDLFAWVDDALPATPGTTGRPQVLRDSELITMLVWNTLRWRQPTLKDLYRLVEDRSRSEFPRLPAYEGFVKHCHRAVPRLARCLDRLLAAGSDLRFVDATKLEVCALKRAGSHRVAREVADFGKGHDGWWYGFKLHAAVNSRGQFAALALTPANVYDAQVLPKLVNSNTRVAVGDTLYGARVMRRQVWERFGTIVVAPAFPSQKKWLRAPWQQKLLDARAGIESMFDYLKEHMNLVSSFPRSVTGYLVHYLRVLLAYQVGVLAG